jgi:N-ethylmaleimide reductase
MAAPGSIASASFKRWRVPSHPKPAAPARGVRLSPFIIFKDMADPEILDTIALVLGCLQDLDIADVDLGEADRDDAPVILDDCRRAFRQAFPNTLIVAGCYTIERAEAVLNAATADLVAFSRAFIANPDLPRRLRSGIALDDFERVILFGACAIGYVDYAPATTA